MIMHRAIRVAAGAGGLALVLACLGPTGAQARTCAIEVEELREIRRLALELAGQNLKIDPGRAAAAQKKYMQALQSGGSISIDPADLDGDPSPNGQPPNARALQPLRGVPKVFRSCNICPSSS